MLGRYKYPCAESAEKDSLHEATTKGIDRMGSNDT
jgi:hypothetical protein